MYKLFIFSLVSLYANFSFGAVCDTVIVGNGIRYEGQYPCGEGVLYRSEEHTSELQSQR